MVRSRRPSLAAVHGVLTLLLVPLSLRAQGVPVVERHVLDNGLEIIVVPSGSIPLVTVELVVRNGAFTQVTEAEEGLPHLLEHMLFKAYREFLEEVSELDASYNGVTGVDAVSYYLTFPAGKLDDGMELIAKLVVEPEFLPRHLDDEQSVVEDEIRRVAADPYEVFRFYQGLYLWGDAAGRKNPMGSVATVTSVTPEQLTDYYRRFYIPNNAALVVSGAVEPEEAFRSAERRFEGWQRGPDPFHALTLPPIEPLSSDTVFVVPQGASDVTFSVAWHGPSAGDFRTIVLGDVLTASANASWGPIQRELVESGLFQAVAFSYPHHGDTGALSLMARTTPENLPDAARHLQEILGALAQPDFITDEDVASAKASLRVARAFMFERTASVAHQVAEEWSVGGLDYFAQYEAAVTAVTPEALREFIGDYLGRRPRVVGVLLSEETIREYQEPIIRSLEGWIRP